MTTSMTHDRRASVLALIAAGLLWGATVPLSKLALGWLSPGWLTVGRFAVAGVVLAVIGRRHLRAALDLRVAVGGALGFGACVVLQNAGIARTSVAHASVLMGVVPVLAALAALAVGHGHASRREWASFVASLCGIALIAGGGGGGAGLIGDALVVASVALSACLIAVQPGLLAGRDPAAVTAVQFFAAAGAALPVALLTGPLPSAPHTGSGPLAFVALALAGTVLPFWLFAHGQAHVRPQLAGAFVNLEPVVGAAIGWVCFADPVGPTEILGAIAVIAAIGLAAYERPIPFLGTLGRVFQYGVDAHEALLAPTWDAPEILHWRRRQGAWTLEGRFAPVQPGDPAEREPEPLLD